MWIAVAEYRREGGSNFAVGAAFTPTAAVMRLCDEVIDGGECQHCHRPAGFAEDIAPIPIGSVVCWQQWDPELSTFRRSCE